MLWRRLSPEARATPTRGCFHCKFTIGKSQPFSTRDTCQLRNGKSQKKPVGSKWSPGAVAGDLAVDDRADPAPAPRGMSGRVKALGMSGRVKALVES